MPTTTDPADPPRPSSDSTALWPALLLLVVGGGLLTAVRTENVNWDEFALLHRTAAFVRTGELQGGGRPGFAELALAPLVRGCRDSISTVWHARTLWVIFTLAYLAGLWTLLRHLPFRQARTGACDAVGLALVVLIPVFARWGLQVRTDQPSLAFGLFGSAVLVAGRRYLAAAVAAGVLLGIGYLFSQKVAYVAALGVLVFGFAWFREASDSMRPRWSGGAARVLALVIGALVPLAIYRYGLSRWVRLPGAVTVAGGLDTFAYYRRYFGYRAYWAMLPTLLPHLALLAGLVYATATRWRQRPDRDALLLAWATLALGLTVGAFHAAAFPYFWLTLGLFPAVAFTVAIEPILASLPTERTRRLALASVLAVLAVQGSVAAAGVLQDTQAPQREALAFVERNFGRDGRGFHPEGALFCRADPSPFPVYFTETIISRFGGPEGAEHTARFEEQFRARPVQFLVPSHVYGQFPPEVRRFWEQHYRPYSHDVRIAAAPVTGRAGASVTVDLLAPGDYRWRSFGDRDRPPRVIVAGRTLTPGERVKLEAGVHTVRLLDDVGAGILQLALDEAPEDPVGPFYSMEAIGQITGRLTW